MRKRSQNQFARDLGVKWKIANRYFSAVTAPQVDFLITLFLQESVSADWVLLGDGEAMLEDRYRGQ